jgi:hypothetical protein
MSEQDGRKRQALTKKCTYPPLFRKGLLNEKVQASEVHLTIFFPCLSETEHIMLGF